MNYELEHLLWFNKLPWHFILVFHNIIIHSFFELFQMVGLYKDPKGERIFAKTSTQSPTKGMGISNVRSNYNQLNENEQEVTTLRQRIKELEDEVKQKEVSVFVLVLC